MSILLGIIGFFLSAFALKLSLKVMGQPAGESQYGTAVTVAGILAVTSFVLSFVPFVGWLLYPIMWLMIVRSVYHISFSKSLVVAVLQVAIRGALFLLLGLIL